ncbi:MAG: hypothetical protein JWM80_6165 [Cyanobacteria bacterium RYN_339]|nr:hypothetical protein [Cyanobacteria bacterium RYN_339]
MLTRPMPALSLASAPVACRDGGLVLPTHPIHNAMRRGMLVTLPSHDEEVKIRVNGKLRRVRVRTGFATQAPRDANLLKTHLDLVDQAYRRPARGMGFWYDLPDALGRMGYQRQAGGQFHPDTTRALAGRLTVLAKGRVSVEEPAIASEPYWRFFAQGEDGALWPLEAHTGRPVRRVLAVPGAWWQAIDLAGYRTALPRGLATLPMDGHGHQVERVTLQLAAELGVWERAEARKGPHVTHRRLGSLLERAGVADKAVLLEAVSRRDNGPKRLRTYLAGEGFADEGALALLRELGGFAVDIKDEAAFWATGRAWVEKFWDARLAIGVRDHGERPLATLPPVAIAHRRAELPHPRAASDT